MSTFEVGDKVEVVGSGIVGEVCIHNFECHIGYEPSDADHSKSNKLKGNISLLRVAINLCFFPRLTRQK